MGIGSLDDIVITYGSAGLRHVFHAALEGALDVVAKREAGIGAEDHVRVLRNPGLSLLSREYRRLRREDVLPLSVRKDILVLISDVEINCIVLVHALDCVLPGKVQYLRRLTNPPVVRLVACKSCAVNAGLLSCTDADRLPALDIADGVGLRVL